MRSGLTRIRCPYRFTGSTSRSGGARPGRFCPPLGAIGEPIAIERLGPDLPAVPGQGRDLIRALPDDHRVEEVLVEVIDVLDHPALEGPAHAQVIDDREVLDELAKADS